MEGTFGMAENSSAHYFDYRKFLEADVHTYIEPVIGRFEGKEYYLKVVSDYPTFHWRTSSRGWLTMRARRRKR